MKIKLIFFLGVVISFGTSTYAQQAGSYSLDSRDKKWLLDITAGANIDMIRSGSSPESKLLGSRPNIVPVVGMRLTWLFSDRIGAYAKLHYNLYKSEKTEYAQSSIIGEILEVLADHLFFPASRLYPSLDAGVVYRLEQDKWKIHPGIGIGYIRYLPDNNSSRTWLKDESEETISYKQRASPIFLNMGLSTRYLVSQRGSLVLDINFQQPLQKSYAELTTRIDGVETDRKSYRTSTVGRNINVSIGYGITF
jgi:hypothetical protein